jgi:hypothetical protein
MLDETSIEGALLGSTLLLLGKLLVGLGELTPLVGSLSDLALELL